VKPRVIEASGISKTFTIPSVRRDTVREHVLDFFRPHPSERLTVLGSVSFELRRGESLGLMGRNGGGKSTLLKIISGIYQPDRGSVTLNAAVTPILELGVGWNPDLDAIDNIELLGTVMGMTLRELRAATADILAFADLERFAKLELRHYSSGMAARLAYAVAFHAVRDVLILDEIFAVGDAGFKERCQARYRELHRSGHSMLLVSHEPRTIATFCDRALLLEGGRIVKAGPASDVADAYLALLTDSSSRPEIEPRPQRAARR
jgi:ABC-2 type transport system ATP-binding protein